MWVMHPDGGFYSAVQSKTDPEQLVIRARVRADLQRLKTWIPELTIVKGGGTDYQYRAFTTRAAWARACASMALDIDYSNFKNAVTARQGRRRHDVYSKVWSALWGLVDLGGHKRRSGFAYDYEPDWARGAPLAPGEGTEWWPR